MTERVFQKGHKQVPPIRRRGRVVVAMVVVLLSGTTLLAGGVFQPHGTMSWISARHFVGLAVPSRVVLVQGLTLASVLKQNLPPPPTLRPQLVSRDPAGDDEIGCVVGKPSGGETAAVPSDCVAEITDWLALSYTGFPTSNDVGHLVSPISVAMAQPDGHVRLFTVTEVTQMLYLRPGTPLGRYDFKASASGRTVSGGFTVKSPTQRTLRVAFDTPDDEQVRPGTPINVDLAGYPALTTVSLHLYRYLSHKDVDTGLTTWRYATQISRISVDLVGQASTSFPTERGDPPGQYLVYSDPPQVSDLNAARFELMQ